MSTILWGPLEDLSTLRETMDQLCEVPFARRQRGRTLAPGRPPVDVFETGDEFIVRAELPGIDTNKQTRVFYKDGILEIRVPKTKPVKSRVQVAAVAR